MTSESYDLVLDRTVAITPAEAYAGWTRAELMKQWFTPAPWQTVDAEIDARPGGIFRTVMRGPDGTENAGTGCILEAVPDRRIVWTSALGPGYRPLSPEEAGKGPFLFTAVLELSPAGEGHTRYVARAIHADAKGRDAHAEMGFEVGWGMALDQLVALMRRERGAR